MRLTEWLTAFKALHRKAHDNALSAEERQVYLAHRDELASALLAAQRLTLQPGQLPRQALRVARALQLDLSIMGDSVRLATLDISAGGFATLLDRMMKPGEEVRFSLRIPGQSAVTGSARMIELKSHGQGGRASFAFLDLPQSERDRIEMFVFDATVEILSGQQK